MSLPTISLLPAKERSVLRRHPWVFSGALAQHKISAHEWAHLCDHNKQVIATGYTDTGSIAFKVLAFEKANPEEVIREKLQAALKRREELSANAAAHTDIRRLCFAEGDGIPGLIIDGYGQNAIIQLYASALIQFLDLIAEVLRRAGFHAVYVKGNKSLHDTKFEDRYLFGSREEEVFYENGIPFKVDWETGQKTGFFIDQRENRQWLGASSLNKSVLNVYAYTGGFSAYALEGGAKRVVSLDRSSKAMEMCEQNMVMISNAARHESVTEDALTYLKGLKEDFDIIVLDPPAFAKSPKARHRAVQAYKRINLLAMKRLAPGGQLFTFSCSQHIDRELFQSTIRAAAIEAKRELRIIRHLQQAADHPISIHHPEGEYLKGLQLQVD